MQANTVTRALVWSRWLRLSHWIMALSTLGLIATGWMMENDTLMAPAAMDIHSLLGALLLPALLLRLYLLFFGRGTDHLSDCEPDLLRLSQAWEVLRYYLTLGRTPLPKWYAHNPLWGPLYLVLFFFLILISASGLLLLNDIQFIAGLSVHDLHWICHQAILWFALLHLPAVFFHDLSGQGGDISGMVNGYRIFDTSAPKDLSGSTVQTVPLTDLLKKPGK